MLLRHHSFECLCESDLFYQKWFATKWSGYIPKMKESLGCSDWNCRQLHEHYWLSWCWKTENHVMMKNRKSLSIQNASNSKCLKYVLLYGNMCRLSVGFDAAGATLELDQKCWISVIFWFSDFADHRNEFQGWITAFQLNFQNLPSTHTPTIDSVASAQVPQCRILSKIRCHCDCAHFVQKCWNSLIFTFWWSDFGSESGALALI